MQEARVSETCSFMLYIQHLSAGRNSALQALISTHLRLRWARTDQHFLFELDCLYQPLLSELNWSNSLICSLHLQVWSWTSRRGNFHFSLYRDKKKKKKNGLLTCALVTQLLSANPDDSDGWTDPQPDVVAVFCLHGLKGHWRSDKKTSGPRNMDVVWMNLWNYIT